MPAKSEFSNSNSILRLYKQNMMLNFMEKKSNEPKLIQKQICNQLGFSDSTIRRYRDGIQMDSPYSRNKYRKENNNPITSTTQTQTTNEITKINKNNKKNELKGGSFLENNQQEDNTKFITIARKLVDNV